MSDIVSWQVTLACAANKSSARRKHRNRCCVTSWMTSESRVYVVRRQSVGYRVIPSHTYDTRVLKRAQACVYTREMHADKSSRATRRAANPRENSWGVTWNSQQTTQFPRRAGRLRPWNRRVGDVNASGGIIVHRDIAIKRAKCLMLGACALVHMRACIREYRN